jgi:transposase
MAAIIAQLEEQVASQKKELEYARLKIQVLEERLRLQRIQKYGSCPRIADAEAVA